jgi:regulator of protease activity HflC (stomatin/prohibitin superfamily)
VKRAGAIGFLFPAVLIGVLVFMSAYTVETGNVAVERTLGKVNNEEQLQGLNFKIPFLTSKQEFSSKEIAIDINDLTPKAADNLSLKDLDVSVFYRVPQDRVSELFVKYAAASGRGADGVYLPAYGLVIREARSAIYEQVSEIDSLQLHKQRESLQSDVLDELQNRLERSDPGDIQITRVVVRALNTDPSIEAAIRDAVETSRSETGTGRDREKRRRD